MGPLFGTPSMLNCSPSCNKSTTLAFTRARRTLQGAVALTRLKLTMDPIPEIIGPLEGASSGLLLGLEDGTIDSFATGLFDGMPDGSILGILVAVDGE
jgi:hypothetical protein